MEMKDRIRTIITLCEAKGNDPWPRGALAGFCKKTKTEHSNVASWLSGGSEPKDEKRRLICDVYAINRKWLDGEGGDMLVGESEIEQPIETVVAQPQEMLQLTNKIDALTKELYETKDKYYALLERHLGEDQRIGNLEGQLKVIGEQLTESRKEAQELHEKLERFRRVGNTRSNLSEG